MNNTSKLIVYRALLKANGKYTVAELSKKLKVKPSRVETAKWYLNKMKGLNIKTKYGRHAPKGGSIDRLIEKYGYKVKKPSSV